MSSISSTGSSTSGLSTSSPLSFTGLASGIDTNQIIQQLVQFQQAQVTSLQNQETGITNQQTAFQAINADLVDLQTQTTALSQSINGVFDGRSVTSSDQNVVTGAASSDATPGVYSLKVNNLAEAQVIASQGFSSPSSTITQGTFGFQVGSNPVTNITIDGSNDTLQGLANAINNSGAGVTASVINDGSSAQGQPYRLVLTSNQTGTANAITITQNLGADSGSAIQPVLNATDFGNAVAGPANTSTSVATTNVGAGNYTGSTDNTYTFTVTNGGTVGTDSGITLSYTDSTGANKGTITLNTSDASVAQTVAQGLTVAFNAGTLNTGDTFTVQAYNPNVQAATNASVSIGSLNITSPTDQLNNVIPGVTLNLVGANPNENVSLTVAANTSGITTAIQNFVNAYNTVVNAINSDTNFNTTTNTAGVLLGNSNVSSIQGQLALAVGNAVPGVNSQLNNLAALGITTNADGTLSLNTNTLSSALSGQTPGVSLNDVKNLFTQSGQSNNPGVQFVTAGNNTQASTTPYQVVVTQAATQGSITGTAVLTGPVTITNTNDTFTISVDGGTAQTITIPPGSYTAIQLAEVIQSQVASDAALAGSNVQVVLSGSQLSFVSPNYGSSSSVTIGGNSTLLGQLGFTVGQTGSGQDVAGNFVVNGQTEAATGQGQQLIGNSGNANTAGLDVQVSLTPAQVAANPQINLTVSQGIASSLGQTLNSLLDPVTGSLQTINQGFQNQIQTIQNSITQDNNQLTQQENQLTTQFAHMEAVISQLKNESTAISSLTGFNFGNSSSSSSPSSLTTPQLSSSSSSS